MAGLESSDLGQGQIEYADCCSRQVLPHYLKLSSDMLVASGVLYWGTGASVSLRVVSIFFITVRTAVRHMTN